jgi:hypothetical protein
VQRAVVSSTAGTFRFDIMPTGNYTLEAVDGAGNVRARATTRINEQADEPVVNLTLIGVGIVSGTVTNPDGTIAPGIPIALQSSVEGFRTFSAITDTAGTYRIGNVPIGNFTASARQRSGQQELFGTAQGSVATDGEQVTRDIQLSLNLAPVTRTFYDANNFAYNLRENGSLQDGTADVFQGDNATNRGAALLDVISNNTPLRFTGQSFGTTDQDGRQISIRQQGLAELNVTRKIFTPRSGYFARYLEVLQNPTSSPITVDVRLTSNFRFIRKVQNGFTFDREPRVVGTSSGDMGLDTSDPTMRDRWAILDDDEDIDPFTQNNLPAVAHVFDGAEGVKQADQAQFTTDFTNRYARMVQEWRTIEVPANSSVALLHFVVEQTTRAAAIASAERLTQLPPEALVGLSADELSQIKNFVAPADGVSTVLGLPPLTGAISGRAFGADGATRIGGAQVFYQSAHPLFGRTHTATTNAAGEWSIASRFNNSGSSIAIPVAGFTLRATDPQTRVSSPLTQGNFPADVVETTQDIVFSNSGIVSGVVRRANGVVVSAGTVQLSGGELAAAITTPIAGDGTYRFTGVTAGTYSLARDDQSPARNRARRQHDNASY